MQKKKGATNRDLGRQSFLNADALYGVMRRIDERGDVAATAKLREVRERLDDNIFDKVALSDLRQLVEFSKQNVIQTYKEWEALHQGSGDAIGKETLSAWAANNFAPPVAQSEAVRQSAPADADYLEKHKEDRPNPGGSESSNISPRDGATSSVSIPQSATESKSGTEISEAADAETDLPFAFSDEYNPDGKPSARPMRMEDFTDTESPVWNNVDYHDDATQEKITRQVHQEMTDAGQIAEVSQETWNRVSKYYPDLRTEKKRDRQPKLKALMAALKSELRNFLSGLKGAYEFEVNGNILEAHLYNTGVEEVMRHITQEKASMLYHSAEIFKNARYLYSTQPDHGAADAFRWNYFYSPVKIGEDVVGVRIAVRDMEKGVNYQPESQIYDWGIKKDATLDGGSHGPKVASPGVSSVTPNDSITQSAAESKGETDAVDKNSESREEKRGAETETRSAAPEAETDAEKFEPGLDYYDPATAEYARTLKQETRTKIDSLSRLLGKRVRFAESVGGGIANGEISGNGIVLSRSALDDESGLVRRVLGHELTHGIQRDAADAYAAFRKAALEASIGNVPVREHAANIRKLAEARGVALTEEAALDEAVADYGGELMSDPETAQRFIQRNRQDKPLLLKIRDALVNLVRKLTGAEKKRVRTVQELFDAALDAAAQAVRKGGAAAQKDSGATRFSINPSYASDIQSWSDNGSAAGETFTLGSTGPVLQGLGAIESDIYMSGDKITKILKDHPEMTLREIKRIAEILENPALILKSKGTRRGNRPVTRLVIFGSVKAQNGLPVMSVLELLPIENNLIIDDMQKVTSAYTKTNRPADFIRESEIVYAEKNRTIPLLRSMGLQMPIELLRSGSIGSITYSGTTVNIAGEKFSSVIAESYVKHSLSGTEDAERLDALIKRNRELEAEVVKFQKRLAEAKTLSGARKNYGAALNLSVTKDFLKTWSSPLSPQSVAPDVMKIANLLRAGPNGDGTSKAVSQRNDRRFLTELDGLARDLAKRVIESAVEEVGNPEVQTIKDFGAEVRKARIAYGDLQAEMGKDFAPWLRRNRFRLGLRKDGRSVDSYWAGWAETYGEMFFPSDITAPADMLRHLEALLDSGAAEYANPFDSYDTLEVIEECKNSLIDALMDAYEKREAPADERRAVRDNAFRKGVEQGRKDEQRKLEAEKERYAKGVRTVRDMIADERAEGERKLQRYRDRASKLREQRIETAKKNAVRRQLERIASRLNRQQCRLVKPDVRVKRIGQKMRRS